MNKNQTRCDEIMKGMNKREFLEKHPPTSQGKCVVQPDGGGFLIMLPDGGIEWVENKKKTEAKCAKWFKANMPASGFGVGEIEWRS